MRILFLVFVLLLSFSAYSQDQILMLSGHVIEGNVTDHNRQRITYDIEKKSGVKNLEVETYRVFSFTKNGKETVLYQRDSTIGNYLSVDEMRHFIYGAQDAMDNYKGRWAFFSGLGVGGVGGYFLGGVQGSFAVVAVPLVYPIVTSIHKIHPHESHVSHPDMINEPSYRTGYHKNTKSRRFFQALKGSLLGTVAGVSAYYAAN